MNDSLTNRFTQKGHVHRWTLHWILKFFQHFSIGFERFAPGTILHAVERNEGILASTPIVASSETPVIDTPHGQVVFALNVGVVVMYVSIHFGRIPYEISQGYHHCQENRNYETAAALGIKVAHDGYIRGTVFRERHLSTVIVVRRGCLLTTTTARTARGNHVLFLLCQVIQIDRGDRGTIHKLLLLLGTISRVSFLGGPHPVQ